MSFPRYAEYKDSGVEWLGEVPQGWDVVKIKHLSMVKRGASPRPIDDPKFFDDNGEYAWVRIADVTASEMYLLNTTQTMSALGSSLSVKLEPNELFLSIAGTVGKPCINKIKACIHDGFVYFPDLKIPVKYLFYIFAGEQAYKGLGKMGTQLNLNTDTVGDIKIALPLLYDDIQNIANFLDHETAKIDNLINEQKKLIDLLKEKRQAVISHAVTKGLNPNAPMKDSGVEWLGKVPEHWEVIKFDYAINTVSDIDHYMPSSVDVGIPYVMTGDLQDFVSDIDFENCKKVTYFDYQKLSGKIKTTKDDIIFARYATIGTLSYVDIDKEFLVSYSCVTIKPNPQRTTGKYLSYYLKSQAFLQAIQQQINSNTQGNVGVDSLRNVKILLPLLFEQEKIVDFLKTELIKIDNLIDKAQSVIQLLQERRTALISAAVTGKIDVRGFVKT